jgi:hypothetical protein
MSQIRTAIALSTAATVSSPWVDLRSVEFCSLQIDVSDVASPVGVVTVEFSNDFNTIENELAQQVTPANSAAVRVNVSAAVTVSGTALASGYDGAGAKASYVDLDDIALPSYARVVYTRTSGGGATDILNVRFQGR